MNYTESMPSEATYWAMAANDGFGGTEYASPILIACRWQDVQKLFRDNQGREFMSEAVVYVDRALAAGGRLVLGDETGSVTPTSEAREIRQTGASSSLDGEETLHKVML